MICVIFGLCFNIIFRYVADLNNLVNLYHSVMGNLSEAKIIMLAQQIKAVKKEMQFGCKRLNWNSLGMKCCFKLIYVL